MHRAVLLAILLLFAAPSAALAGTAVVSEEVNRGGGRSPTLAYSALPGERNIVTMTRALPGAVASVRIHDAGAAVVPGAGCTAIDTHTVECRQAPYVLNGVTLQQEPAVVIDAGDGDDVVTALRGYADFDVRVLGGDGADALTGAGHLAGGPGDDVLTSTSPVPEICDKGGCGVPRTILAGGTGNDVLRGGPGSDVLIGDADGDSDATGDPGGGNDVMDGGPGADSAVYSARVTPVRVDLAGALRSGSLGESDRLTAIESVTGGHGPDVLLGDDSANVLRGGPGDDTLDGRGGNDYLEDGPGSDTLLGRAGNDELVGQQPGDALYGGPGDDTLWNPIGASLLFARVVHCGSGRDVTFTPQGQLLAGCEQIRLGDVLVLPPRRLRDGRLRSVLRCGAGVRCELVVKVRRGSRVLARRSVTIPFGRMRDLDLRPRAAVRAGQLLDVTISGRNVIMGTTGSRAVYGRWRMRA